MARIPFSRNFGQLQREPEDRMSKEEPLKKFVPIRPPVRPQPDAVDDVSAEEQALVDHAADRRVYEASIAEREAVAAKALAASPDAARGAPDATLEGKK